MERDEKRPIISLATLHPGETGIVQSLEGEVYFQKRLSDLGFIPGTPITLIRKAPFGDPLEVKVRGYQLALRKKDASRILLRPHVS